MRRPQELKKYEEYVAPLPAGVKGFGEPQKRKLFQCPHCGLIGEKYDIKVLKPQEWPGLLPLLSNDYPMPAVHYHPYQDECRECEVGECSRCKIQII